MAFPVPRPALSEEVLAGTDLYLAEDANHSGGRDAFPMDLPRWSHKWDSEFEESHYEPNALRYMSATLFVFGMVGFAFDVTNKSDQAIGGPVWTWVTYSGELAAGLFSFIVYGILSAPQLRGVCVRRYQALCVAWLLGVTTGWMLMMFFVEHRRHSLNHSEVLYHNVTITYHRMHTGGWPRRECTDSDPRTTLMMAREFWEPGCLCSMLGTGGSLGVFLAGLLGMPLLNLRPASAALAMLFLCVIFGLLSVLIGWSGGNFCATIILMCATGMFATVLCDLQLKGAHQEFAMRKSILVASEQQRRLLCTLIPPNVLDNLELAQEARHISMCTVMFCRVKLAVDSKEALESLNKLFLKFDACVQRSSMFKYQHVCTGDSFYYIVGCDRVANPYDEEIQSSPYPECDAWLGMARLALQFMALAADDTCSIYFGISSGPAAGIVLGKIRRFYCIYGDTLNEAARMCSLAAANQILAPTSKVARVHECLERMTNEAAASRQSNPAIMSRSLGVFHVKGKGDMAVDALWLAASDDNSSQDPPTPERRRSSEACVSSGLGYEELASMTTVTDNASNVWATKYQGLLLPRHKIHPGLSFFTDPAYEHAFQRTQIPTNRRALSVALIWSLIFTIWSAQVVMMPDEAAYWDSHGDDALQSSMDFVFTTLLLNISLNALACVLILLCLWPEFARRIWLGPGARALGEVASASRSDLPGLESYTRSVYGFVVLKFVVFIILAISGQYWTARRGVFAVLSAMSMLNFGCSFVELGVSFKAHVASCAVILAALVVASILNTVEDKSWLPKYWQPPRVTVGVATFLVAMFVLSVVVSRSVNFHRRRAWLLRTFLRTELRFLRRLLVDLLPQHYADDLVAGSFELEVVESDAVVLQLDFVAFTQLAERLSPSQLASLLNKVFSRFDDALSDDKQRAFDAQSYVASRFSSQRRRSSAGHFDPQHESLFKVDTIGDAYVVVCWLPASNSDPEMPNPTSLVGSLAGRYDRRAQACSDMLEVAAAMLQVLEDERSSGVEIHGRIGLTIGPSVCGVVGALQPRFCVAGKVVSEVAELEKSGAANTVHVSSKCIDMLDAASNETGTLAEPSQVNPHFDREGRSSEWEPWASDGRWLIKRKEVKTSATLSYLLQLQGSRSERGE